MPNGVAYPLPVELEPSPPDTSIEYRVGIATAEAVVASCQALMDFWAGGAMTPATRAANGEWIAQLYELQQQAPSGFDFAGTVIREGKFVLRQRYGAWFRAHHNGANIPEPMLDILLSDLLEILARVTATEQRLAH
jgi:hypothetical protein